LIEYTGIQNQALPSVDVPTRWNSTYLMLKSALPYKKAFKHLSDGDANYPHCLTDDEWKKIGMMKDFLKVLNSGMFFYSLILIFQFKLGTNMCHDGPFSYFKIRNDPMSNCAHVIHDHGSHQQAA
jgi:hypothetical protein